MTTIRKLKYCNSGDFVKTTKQGTISFQLINGISVDITVDGSIRVANRMANAVAAINREGNISALMHPVGFMYHEDDAVEVQTNDIRLRNHKLAKIGPNGVHFKAIKSSVVYLVDEAGVRTNFSENFASIDTDITLNVLYKNCRHGHMYLNVCNDLLSDIQSKVSENGIEWRFYNVVIMQENSNNFVRVKREGKYKFEIRTSPIIGTINFYSDAVDCTASHGDNPHFFVRKNKTRVHYEVNKNFMVRYGGYNTGFNELNEITYF